MSESRVEFIPFKPCRLKLVVKQGKIWIVFSKREKRFWAGGSGSKESSCRVGDRVGSLGQEDPLEKGMTIRSSILARGIAWTEQPGGLQPMRSQRVGHN